jgi:beta-phosphoglucomutase-like phosphatase (HAD superfamily)
MKAVIFDLDGTIVDSIDIYYEMVKLTCERIGLEIPDKNIVLKLMSQGRSLFDGILPIDIKDRDSFIKRLRMIGKEIWEEKISNIEIKLIPGADKTLKN